MQRCKAAIFKKVNTYYLIPSFTSPSKLQILNLNCVLLFNNTLFLYSFASLHEKEMPGTLREIKK